MKPSRDNIPHHPPPRRDNSVTFPVRPPLLPGMLDRGPLRPPSLHLQASGSTGDNNPNEIDGYMTPNRVKVKTVSNGVHYTAPDKPRFDFNILDGAASNTNNSKTQRNESARPPRKPKHYRRSAASNFSNEIDSSVTESHFNSFHSNNPDFAENNNHMNVAQDHTELEGDAYNEISEVINKFNLKPDANKFISNRVHKPKPKPPPMPKPRLPTNETRSDGDSSKPKSHLKSPLKPVYSKLRPDIHDTNAQGYSELEPHLMPKLKPVNDKFLEKDVASSATLTDSRPKVPLKPKPNHAELKSKLDKLLSVESRVGDGSETTDDNMDSKSPDQGDNDNHVVYKSKALRPPTRPPMRPVPRRQKAERNAHDNPSFEEDTVVNI